MYSVNVKPFYSIEMCMTNIGTYWSIKVCDKIHFTLSHFLVLLHEFAYSFTIRIWNILNTILSTYNSNTTDYFKIHFKD
jgi:hypothetical protein